LITKKEQIYNDLKRILVHQPGPEILDNLSLYQEHVKTKKIQCDKMTSELSIYQQKVLELKEELQRSHRQHVDMKKKLYEGRKKERASTMSRNDEKSTIQIQHPQLPRFTGGGFNLSL